MMGAGARYTAEAWASRFVESTAHQERRRDTGKLEQAPEGRQQPSPGSE